jgi:aldehyde dehydrogenase (NAD+)
MHFHRLRKHIEQNKDHIYCGGACDSQDRFIEPTVFTNLDKGSSLMSEELFGPLLPVFKYSHVDEIINYVNSDEKPLTMYIFARDQRFVDKLITSISSGSVLVNDTLFNFANIHAPFGGVGHSGMGGYRGRFSFECFSHRRSILRRDDHAWLDMPIRYPPYSKFALNVFLLAMKIPDLPAMSFRKLLLHLLGLGALAYAMLCYFNKV